MKITTERYTFRHMAMVIMCIIFIINLIISEDCNLLWLLLSGGGSIVDYLGESYSAVFNELQVYRLITYGYTQTAVWHLAANVLGVWYVGLYLEKKIGSIRFMFIYHTALIAAGIVNLVCCPDIVSYGASPAIFACLGVLASWLIRKRALWDEYKAQKGFYFLLYYFALSNFLGMHTLLFHLFGLCTGFLLGFVIKEQG